MPPVILDTKAPPACTVTWLLDDTANNDIFAARMRIDPGDQDSPVNGRMPCPTNIAPRVADRALEVCTSRTADPKTCVFADMARDFEARSRYAQHGGERLALHLGQGRADRSGLLDVGQPRGLQCRLRRHRGGRETVRSGALRGQAAAQLPDYGIGAGLRAVTVERVTAERSVTSGLSANGVSASGVNACATATEWRICAASFRWSAVSKNADRG